MHAGRLQKVHSAKCNKCHGIVVVVVVVVHDKHQWFALTNNIHESGNIKRFVAGNMILQADESEMHMQVGSTEGPGSKSEIKYFGKLPPHLLAHDVSAAAVSCHFGPQSSEAEVPPGSLPLSLLLCSKRWFSLHCSKADATLLFCAWPQMACFCFPLFLCVLFGRRLKCFPLLGRWVKIQMGVCGLAEM